MTDFLQNLLPPKAMYGDFNTDDTAEVLHHQTKYNRANFTSQLKRISQYVWQQPYMERGAAGLNQFPSFPLIALPEPMALEGALGEVLARRHSCRTVTGTLTLEELSTLLHHAVRVSRFTKSAIVPHVSKNFRPYPSPGGLYGTEFYLILNRVEGVEPCIAHYDPRKHELRITRRQDGRAFADVEMVGESDATDAPVIMVLTSVPQRITAKYGPRGYRLALLEAGHAGQNLCLSALGVGLQSLVYGAYYDDELSEQLDIDGVTETVFSVILLGREGV